ncbi:MAG TPA: hypothetical protein ENK53_05600 [Thiotrichales bacterium]|nr:hypothetical protein [Thiotrichales bacterium]
MGTIYDMKAFYRWVDESTNKELLQRRDSLLNAIGKLTDENVLADARFLLRKIEEEILAREIQE